MGPAQNLPGPDYQIGPDLGQQRGGNLFHSFQDFNLQRFESATFSGPNHIQAVISRVTGGNPSQIDGLFRSTIPGADVYFLNPYGIMFGPNARLDVQGSFHASTADYLRLGDGGRFDARNPSDSILTVAPIESFGFLNNQVAPISIQGHGEVTPDWKGQATGLSVPEGKTLSLIGGQIEMWMGTFFRTMTVDDKGIENIEMTYLNSLHAPSGRIHLAAVASQGEVKLGENVLDMSSFSQLADISITEQSLLQISGEGAGHLFIRGQDILFKDSQIVAKSYGDRDSGMIHIHSFGSIRFQDGGRIEIEIAGKGQGADLTLEAAEMIEFSGINLDNTLFSGIFQRTFSKEEGAGDVGSLSIKAKNLSLDGGSELLLLTYGKGNSGNISIDVEETLSVKGINPISLQGCQIRSSPAPASNGGHGGTITVKAKDILLMDGGYISATTFGPGDGSNVMVEAKNTITLTGVNNQGYVSGIFSQAFPRENMLIGNAGNIVIKANELLIEKGALISSNTTAKNGQTSGQGGNITIHVTGKLDIAGINVHGENEDGFSSGISVSSRSIDGGHTGDAGNIMIIAGSLSIKEGGMITSSTLGSGDGGQITIDVNGPIMITGDSSKIAQKAPLFTQLRFQNDNPNWKESTSNSGIYASSDGNIESTGQGGNITLYANRLSIDDKGKISTASVGSGLAGNIEIHSDDDILMSNGSAITTEAKSAGGGGINLKIDNLLNMANSEITTSVQESTGSGGDIELHSKFVVLNKGQIKAQADAGYGGNIRIVADQFIDSLDSLVSASSRLGLDGHVEIDSPAVDLDAMLVVLQGNQIEAKLKTCNVIEELDNPTYTFEVKKRFLSPPLMK
ncbi:Large protein containing haemagglutination activity domain [Beggiatoa sp. PS]|nr:Large protein containing haemagglutination activity domain [Beggiatoa sp. PS]